MNTGPHGDPIIIYNATKDPSYCPYCLRCTHAVRMRKVEPFYWRHDKCGAEHDERENVRRNNEEH